MLDWKVAEDTGSTEREERRLAGKLSPRSQTVRNDFHDMTSSLKDNMLRDLRVKKARLSKMNVTSKEASPPEKSNDTVKAKSKKQGKEMGTTNRSTQTNHESPKPEPKHGAKEQMKNKSQSKPTLNKRQSKPALNKRQSKPALNKRASKAQHGNQPSSDVVKVEIVDGKPVFLETDQSKNHPTEGQKRMQQAVIRVATRKDLKRSKKKNRRLPSHPEDQALVQALAQAEDGDVITLTTQNVRNPPIARGRHSRRQMRTAQRKARR